MFNVVVSSSFASAFRALPKGTQRRIRAGLDRLAQDPRKPRSGADIKPLKATDPPKHRLRIGEHRVIHIIEGNSVRVLDVFSRERGYRE